MSDSRALEGNRRLSKSFGPLYIDYNELAGTYEIPDGLFGDYSRQWQKGDPTGISWYIEDYFDTSGYTRDSLTTFPQLAFVQEAGRYRINQNQQGSGLIIIDMITTEKINDVYIDLVLPLINQNAKIPGFPSTTEEWEQVVYGRLREFLPITVGTASTDLLGPVSNQSFGSLEAITNDKLWIYKILIRIGTTGSDLSFILFPSSRTVLDINVSKESDTAYMMRQKRSYELQQLD